MKKILLSSLLLVGALLAGMVGSRAQTIAPPLTLISTIAHTSCPAVVANTTQYCFASDGLFVSLSGAAYTQLNVAGLSGVSVCNVAGTSCSMAPVASGVATVNVPKSASVTTTVTAPPLSVSSGNLVVGAPTATSSASLQ